MIMLQGNNDSSPRIASDLRPQIGNTEPKSNFKRTTMPDGQTRSFWRFISNVAAISTSTALRKAFSDEMISSIDRREERWRDVVGTLERESE